MRDWWEVVPRPAWREAYTQALPVIQARMPRVVASSLAADEWGRARHERFTALGGAALEAYTAWDVYRGHL